MAVAPQPRAREPRAVDEGCVAEAIEQHALPAARERAQHREVCHVAGGKKQRALAPGEGRQLLFQALVLGAVPLTRCEAPLPAPVRAAQALMAAAGPGWRARPR